MNRQSLPLTRLTTGKGDRSSSSAMPTAKPTAWAIALATALVASSCSQAPPTDTAASPSPAASSTTSPTSSATTTAPRTVPFNNPMVPGNGNVAGVPGAPRLQQFIPPTNPDTAATQAQADINKAKSTRDPFAIPLQLSPTAQAPVPSPGTKPGQPGSTGQPGIGLPGQPGSTQRPSNVDSRFDISLPGGLAQPPKAVPVISKLPPFVGIPRWQPLEVPKGDVPGPAFRGFPPPDISDPPKIVPQVARPPEPVDARQVKIAGVIQTDKDFKIIVQSPGESARYASVGEYVASGKVLIKRVALDSMYDPVVILEQFGQEVRKSVGEVTALSTSTNSNSAPAKTN